MVRTSPDRSYRPAGLAAEQRPSAAAKHLADGPDVPETVAPEFADRFSVQFQDRITRPMAVRCKQVHPDAGPWPPPPFERPVLVAGINTAILVTSSFTIHWALQSIKRGNRAGMKAGLVLTFLLGLTFLLTQIREYSRLGFAPHDGAFGSTFYALTGLHGAHVFVGLTILLFMTIRAFRGHFTPEEHYGVEIGGIYWHFVDVMWIVVYVTVYLL